MQKTQKTYTAEFKREAVRLAQTSGKPITHIARELGISDTSIHQWRKELAEHSVEAFPGSGHQAALEEENRRLKRELERVRQERDILKKNGRSLCVRPAMKYQFIEEQQGEYPISVLCESLEVSVSGYYAWRKRPMSHHDQEDAQIAEQVKEAFFANRRGYGSPRIHAEPRAQGIRCGQKRVARLMRVQGLVVRRPCHRTITTQRDPGANVALNLLPRDFSAEQPNTRWGAETTYIWTAEGWLYLAVVLELFSRMVVGWSMAAVQDATLVIQALRMAVARRQPEAGLLHHTDRGSTSTSESYQVLLRQEGMIVSMSRTADCYANAAMESFFHSFKGECIDDQSFQTRAQARSAPFDYLETF